MCRARPIELRYNIFIYSYILGAPLVEWGAKLINPIGCMYVVFSIKLRSSIIKSTILRLSTRGSDIELNVGS